MENVASADCLRTSFAGSPRRGEVVTTASKPATILLIDDEVEVRATVSRLLQRAGYEVVTAANGADALETARFVRANLIITDILMPTKEGLETIIELRHEFPELPVIAVSGGGIVDPGSYLALAQKLGADRVLAKPFGITELLSAVRELLDA
jgi:DNA-binding response OmpR family regulator